MTRFRIRLACTFLFCGSATFFSGCGRSGEPLTAKVEGTVTLDGAPVKGATVTFAPLNGRASSGQTNERGEYVLTFKRGIPGALHGKHQVKITKFVADNSKQAIAFAANLHAKQKKFDESRGFIPDEDVAVDPKPKMTGMESANILPAQYGGTESILTATVEPESNVLNFTLSTDVGK